MSGIYATVNAINICMHCKIYGCVCVLAGEQLERAFHLSLAALLGEGVYNFGELVSYNLIQSWYYIIKYSYKGYRVSLGKFLCVYSTVMFIDLLLFQN